MRYLLDTCTLLFATTEPESLGKDIRYLFDDYDNEFCVSIETVKELIIAFKNKGLKFHTCKNCEDIIDTIKNVFFVYHSTFARRTDANIRQT